MPERNGPFIFCDYWASIMGFKNVVSEYLLKSERISLELFRKGLDRPNTSLPRIRNYILPPGFMIGKLMKKLRKPDGMLPSHAEVLRQKIQAKLDPMKLQVTPADGSDPRWVTVHSNGDTVARNVISPDVVQVLVSKFLSTWKIVIAFILTIIFSVSIVPILHELRIWRFISAFFPFLFYPLLASFLYLVFRDFLTATLVPLPVLAARELVKLSGVSGFMLIMVGIGLLAFFIQCFFIPKSVPPTLYLYVNDKKNPFFSYMGKHAPYWLEGRSYWVWRFMTFSPAQLSKFWERDWERIEVWIRADRSPEAGNIEWLVVDYHYRELWYNCARQMDSRYLRAQQVKKRVWFSLGRRMTWVVLVDMDVLFHTPVLRGTVLTQSSRRTRSAILGALRAFISSRQRDRFSDYRESLGDLEIKGNEFLEDVPEHFRSLVLRRLIEEPWSFWRYPRGATATLKIHLYDPNSLKGLEDLSVSDPNFQVKSAG
jgi:hypothetical protein